MVQERHELLERALEVDVVFPERVVGIDDQILAVHGCGCAFGFGRGARWKGISKMASTSTATPSRSAGVNSHFASASSALRSRRSSSCRKTNSPDLVQKATVASILGRHRVHYALTTKALLHRLNHYQSNPKL